jgi:hypothetical protein
MGMGRIFIDRWFRFLRRGDFVVVVVVVIIVSIFSLEGVALGGLRLVVLFSTGMVSPPSELTVRCVLVVRSRFSRSYQAKLMVHGRVGVRVHPISRRRKMSE